MNIDLKNKILNKIMSTTTVLCQLCVNEEEKEYISDNLEDSIFKNSKLSKKTLCAKQTASVFSSGDNNWGSKLHFNIQRVGDLLSKCYLVIKLPDISIDSIKAKLLNDGENPDDYYLKWVDYVGNTIIKNAKIKIGNNVLVEHSGEFIQVITDLYDKPNKLCLIGSDETLTKPQYTIDSNYIYVPLKFWFCEGLENALPLVALQYRETVIEIELRDFHDCYQILKKIDSSHYVNIQSRYKLPKHNIMECRLDANMIYLSNHERKEMGSKKHSFLITQTQEIKQNLGQNNNIDISSLKHNIRESFFYIQNDKIKNQPELFNFSSKCQFIPLEIYESEGFTVEKWDNFNKLHLLSEARYLINQEPRENWKDFKYYHNLQNYENYRNKLEHFVYLYAFSGYLKNSSLRNGLNFSRFTNSCLQVRLNENTFKRMKEVGYNENDLNDNNFNLHFFAVNYNYVDIEWNNVSLRYKD